MVKNWSFAPGLIILAAFIISCSGSSGKNGESRRQSPAVDKEDLVRANQFLVGKDMELIDAYISRRNWNMTFTKTGLGYQVYKKGDGPEVKRGNTVSLEYTVSLLNGDICYSSDDDGPMTFRVGQGGVEAGLEEAVLMLRKGDRARLILPPFLGHGLIGDHNRIPPRAVLVYEVEVINVVS